MRRGPERPSASEGVGTARPRADASLMDGTTQPRQRTTWSARLGLWAWVLIGCPLLTLGAVSVAGSDGSATKFVFLFVVFPAVLVVLGGWVLPVRAGEVIIAALV